MAFTCRSIFQVILFLSLPVLSFGQYNLLGGYSTMHCSNNDTIFLTDHYVYGISGAFKYILSEQDEEGRIVKPDTIIEQMNTKPETRKKNQKQQINERDANDPASPCALLYKRRDKLMNDYQESCCKISQCSFM